MQKDLAVSPGVAVGRAYCIHEVFVNPNTKRLGDQEVTTELAKSVAARDHVTQELTNLQRKVEKQVVPEGAAIFSNGDNRRWACLKSRASSRIVRGWNDLDIGDKCHGGPEIW